MSFVDPALQQITAMQAQIQTLTELVAAEPPPPINLTITLPPLDLHVSNVVEPAPVHVSNDVHPSPVHVPAPSQPAIHVDVPQTGGAKEITFERDKQGMIVAAHVVETAKRKTG